MQGPWTTGIRLVISGCVDARENNEALLDIPECCITKRGREPCPPFAAFGQGDRLFNSDPDCSHTAFIAAQNRTWWLAAQAAHIKFGSPLWAFLDGVSSPR